MCTHFFSFVLYDLCWPNEFELEILLFVSNRPCPPAVHVASSVANAMRLHRPLVPQRPLNCRACNASRCQCKRCTHSPK